MAPGAGSRAWLLWWLRHPVAPVGQCQPLCRWLAMSRVACTSGLPAHSAPASLLAQCCLFPDASRCFLFKDMDRWLQAVV